MLVLSEKDVQGLLRVEELIETLEQAHIQFSTGKVLAGKKPGRTSAEEITLYKSVGIAVQDVAAAHLLYQKALEKKVGISVEV